MQTENGVQKLNVTLAKLQICNDKLSGNEQGIQLNYLVCTLASCLVAAVIVFIRIRIDNYKLELPIYLQARVQRAPHHRTFTHCLRMFPDRTNGRRHSIFQTLLRTISFHVNN